jgi:TonB-linked SusC/RagA family outer membrane protein
MGNHRRILGLSLTALLAGSGLAFAQGRQVSGTVTRVGTGAPIPEAVIAVSGGTASTRTDAQGRYTLQVPAGDVRLTARAIGFTRKDALVPASQSTVNFVLDQDVFKLDEVVVSGQATTVQRRNLTTSVGYVSGDDLTKVASPTLESALYGKLAGVNIQGNGGAPGGGVQLQVRGANTILGAFDPLFVVDGVIYSNARVLGGRATIDDGASILEDDPVNRLADLNPADIASIEVLKGASAAAIYGSQAASGVVIVKTIRGQSGAPRVNLSQRLGTFDLLRQYNPNCFSTVAEAVAVYGAPAQAYLGTHSLGCFNHYDQVWGGHDLSYETVADVSGGTESTKYFMSGTWKRDNAIEPGTGFGRQALRANIDQNLGEKIEVSVSSVFNRAFHQRGWGNNCNNFACYGYAIAYIPSYVDLRKQADGSYINPATSAGSAPNSNPLQTAEFTRNATETYRFTGGTTLTYKAHTTEKSSLRIVGTLGADLFSQNDDLLSPNNMFYELIQARPGTTIENEGISRLLNWNANAAHTIRFGGTQFATAVGIQYAANRLKTARITTDNLLPGQQNVNRGTNFVVAENLVEDRNLAFYGQEDINLFNDRFTVSGGVRAERSSSNGNISKYYLFPRISGKYSFRDLLGAGSELKLRAGYGELGNPPNFGNKFTVLNTPQYGGQIGLAVGQVSGDAGIEPERVKEIEGGFDLNFWGGRANIDVTAYRRRTTNLLLSRTPAPSTGFTSQIFNGGVISNKGLEVALGLTPIQTRNFNWVSSTSFTIHRSNVDSLPVPAFRPPGAGFGGLGVLFIEQGHPLTRIYGPKFFEQGVDPDAVKPAGCTTVPSLACVIQGTVGDTEPDFRIGFTNGFTYKALNVSVTVDYQKGGTVTNLTQVLLDDGKTAEDFGESTYTARWDNAFAGFGVISPYIEDATFVKLREVSINWAFPRRWVDAIGLGARDVRLGLTGRDLLWSTNYSGLDPEVANFGAQAIRSNVDVGPYPPSRSVFLNIAVGF